MSVDAILGRMRELAKLSLPTDNQNDEFFELFQMLDELMMKGSVPIIWWEAIGRKLRRH